MLIVLVFRPAAHLFAGILEQKSQAAVDLKRGEPFPPVSSFLSRARAGPAAQKHPHIILSEYWQTALVLPFMNTIKGRGAWEGPSSRIPVA